MDIANKSACMNQRERLIFRIKPSPFRILLLLLLCFLFTFLYICTLYTKCEIKVLKIAMSDVSNPLISIIVPAYNVERYLAQCIESIINQTFQEWELLLIDDGSTDKSGVICDEYAKRDSRIRVLHKENSGQADSRNIALDMARADLVGFVDSDDWIEPAMYADLYRTLLEQKVDIAICGYFFDYKNKVLPVGESGETICYTRDEALTLILEDKIIKSFLWDKLFRKSVITELLPKSYYFEDYATLFKWFAAARTVAFYQKPLYHYRQRNSSTDHDDNPAKKYHFFVAELERYHYLRKHQIFPEKQEQFAQKVIVIGVNTAKGMARSSADKECVKHYIGKIKNELEEMLPVSFYGMKRKYRNYYRQLQYSVSWFIFSMRFGSLFSLNQAKRKYELYE